MILPLAIPYWATGLLVGAFLVVCVILMLVVLIQRPQGGGLSGAFGAGGGGGAGQTAFGTKTGDALTMATIGMFVLYLLMAIGLNFATRPENIDGVMVPTVQSAAPEDLSGVLPLPAEDTGVDATTTEDGTDDTATDAVDDAAAAVEQAANEIVNDAQDAATEATDSTTPPTDQPTEQPAEQPTGETPPPTF